MSPPVIMGSWADLPATVPPCRKTQEVIPIPLRYRNLIFQLYNFIVWNFVDNIRDVLSVIFGTFCSL